MRLVRGFIKESSCISWLFNMNLDSLTQALSTSE
jgi:hypothetical protein